MKISPRTSQIVGHVLALQPMRDVRDGAHIGGDVLARKAVAARQRLDEPAVLVAQRDGQAVDLGLRRDGQRRFRAASPRKRRTRATNSPTSASSKMLPSESIGTRCRTEENFCAGGAPTLAPGPPGAARLGNASSRASSCRLQRVVFGVRNRRGVVLVIGDVVPREFRREAGMILAGFGFGRGQGRRTGHGV